MPYLNVDEVESAIELVADSNPGLTELIELPRSTWEGRTSRAIRVHKGGAIAEGIYLLGGVHAREWGSSDILISFVQRITDAYRTGTGITWAARPSAHRTSVVLSRRWKLLFSLRSIPTAGATRCPSTRCGARTGAPREVRRRPAPSVAATGRASTSTAITTSSGISRQNSVRPPR